MSQISITQDYIDHFSQTPSMYASCVDEQNRPETTRVLGGWCDLNSNIVSFAVESSQSKRLLSLAQVGRRVALVSVTLSDYLTYQYKGEVISAEPSSTIETEKIQTYIDEFCRRVAFVGIDSDRYRVGFAGSEYSVISFRVDSIFDQTPRVGAGALIKSNH